MTEKQRKEIDQAKDQAAIDWANGQTAYRSEVLHLEQVERFDQIEHLLKVGDIGKQDYDDVMDMAIQIYRIKVLEEAVLACEDQGDYTHDVLRQYVLSEKARLKP